MACSLPGMEANTLSKTDEAPDLGKVWRKGRMGLQLNLGVKYIILGTLELSLSFLKYVITHNPLNKYLLSAYYVRDPFQVQ